MPATSSLQEADTAELVLEQLLKPWPIVVDTPARSPRPFVFAFLPSAAHAITRPPSVRLPPRSIERTSSQRLGALPDGRVDHGAAEERALPKRLSFGMVAATVSRPRWRDGDRWEADPRGSAGESATPRDATDIDDAGFDDHRFAARVVALKVAGALDLPAVAGGGSPAPTAYAEVYRSIDSLDDNPSLPSHACSPSVAAAAAACGAGAADPLFSNDDSAEPALSSIFL